MRDAGTCATMSDTNAGQGLCSVCLIVKNEAEHLGRCLESVKGLADEIIVVDTGSTDGTVELARKSGARVICAKWTNDFSRARNLSLEAARGKWIFVLDADEFLEPGAREEIGRLLRSTPQTGACGTMAFALVQKNTGDFGRTGMMVSIVRLFPNRADVRYEWPIHEQVATSLMRARVSIVETSIEFLHTGYADPARNLEKQRRNLAILNAQIALNVEVYPLTWFLLGGAYLDLGDPERALVSYSECRRLAGAETEMGRGAGVRMASCLLKLNRAAEAISGMPSHQDAVWHPELMVLRGAAEASLGRTEEARRWLERVLGCADGVFVPPCNLANVKAEAMALLGTHWKDAGQLPVAVALMRLARDCHLEGRDFTRGMLAEVYRAHGVA